MIKREDEYYRVIQFILLLLYLLVILYITVFCREGKFQASVELTPFWSYRLWFEGDKTLGMEIILNIGLFVPFGFIFMNTLDYGKKRAIIVITIGFLLSVLIEGIQWYYRLGLTEFDDVFNNTLGTTLGVLLFCICHRLHKLILIIISGSLLLVGIIQVIGVT